MKKFIVVLSMITCLFGMTACGEEKSYTEFEQQKMEVASQVGSQYVIPFVQSLAEALETPEYAFFNELTNEEFAQQYNKAIGGETTGAVLRSGIASYNSAVAVMGEIVSVGNGTATISGETIIVTVPVQGTKKNAEIEMIYSNDQFFDLQSFAVNVQYSFGETMAKAGENTLVGIGTVFVMLILISFIISLFAYIPKIQESLTKKKESPKTEAIEKAVAQIEKSEEAAVSEDLSDDLELVAVIAAAIAAYEGSASADGFVVRSIRKVNRR